MATNILGYNRTRFPNDGAGRLISSDFAGLRMDSTGIDLALVQNATVNYGHNVTPRFEAGSAELYWLAGQAQGSVNIARAVSSAGFLAGLTPGAAAGGSLVQFSLNVKPSALVNDAGQANNIQARTSLKFRGGIIAAIGATVATGNLDVSESVTINFADLIGGAGNTAPGGAAAAVV